MYIYVIYVLSFAHLSLFHTLVGMQNNTQQDKYNTYAASENLVCSMAMLKP